MHNEDRSNGCCALVFSPSRAGRGNSFRVGETSLLSVPFRRAWADLIGGRSADRRRILTRVCGQGISSQKERRGEEKSWTLIGGSLVYVVLPHLAKWSNEIPR